MHKPIFQRLTNNLLNIPGWSTGRKILVIESDDWGTVRMESKGAFDALRKRGIPVEKCAYNSNDTLEGNDDLELLFSVLDSAKDSKGNPAVITANNIVANPDFGKIKASNFETYSYESFTDTLKRYPGRELVLDLYREGINRKLIKPQFHGREHLHVRRWMQALKAGNPILKSAFEYNMFTVHARFEPHYKTEYMDAFGYDSITEPPQQAKIIEEGLKLFKEIWGFESRSFIAPCYILGKELFPVLKREGIKYVQGLVNQMQPIPGEPYRHKKLFRFQGDRDKTGLRFLVRNVFFEPALNPGIDSVNDSLHRIKVAFKWNKPAIVSSHRLNYMGMLNPANRDGNLKKLNQLLHEAVKQWPDIEFMTSDQLGDLMSE